MDALSETSSGETARIATGRWLSLLVASAALSLALNACGLPASMLLGPLIAGIAHGASDRRVAIPNMAYALAQGIIGCMIANVLPVGFLGDLAQHWPLFAIGVPGVMGLAAFLGWLIARAGVLPGSTAVWGLSPGAASAIIVLSGTAGADARLVAFMQYTRIFLVTAAASIIARVAGATPAAGVQTALTPAAFDWVGFGLTMALTVLGPIASRVLRIPAGGLLLPFFVGVVASQAGWLTIVQPHWILVAGYTLIGWRIGLSFTRPLLMHALAALPRIILSTLFLMLACGALAAVFVFVAGLDPLTAYLATSPGGADSVAIIAASVKVDAPFVMTMQMTRMVCVLVFGPILARLVSRSTGG